jgi:hypothetical protein
MEAAISLRAVDGSSSIETLHELTFVARLMPTPLRQGPGAFLSADSVKTAPIRHLERRSVNEFQPTRPD